MKQIRYVAVTLTVTVLVFLMQISTSAQLYHQTSNLLQKMTPRLTTDPNSTKYYVTSNVSFSSHTSYVRTGIESWNSSTYDIDITETTTYSSSVCDVKGYNGNSSSYADQKDLLGFTIVYCGDGAYSGNNTAYYDSNDIPRDYWMGEVYINYTEIPASDLSSSATQKKLIVVAAHEMGHVLGLGHVTSTQYIMKDGYSASQPTAPTNSEKEAVQELYDYRNYVWEGD